MELQMLNKIEYGDFQTPNSLACEVTKLVADIVGKNSPRLVIEPTCGVGAFVKAAKEHFQCSDILGADINPDYIKIAKSSCSSESIKLINKDFFKIDWNKIISQYNENDLILVLGNPPWITNSTLGALSSNNKPKKLNSDKLLGIEAITGKSNFDISEYMLLEFLKWINGRNGIIAVLCKTSVARRIVKKEKDRIAAFRIYPIDTKKFFNANVDSCLFVIDTRTQNKDCIVYHSIFDPTESYRFGEQDGILIRDISKFEQYKYLLSNQTQLLTWRSGIKHDCSKIMELNKRNNVFVNGLNEELSFTNDKLIFPLLKSSDISNGRLNNRKFVVVPQRFVGQDTLSLKQTDNDVWQYLERNSYYLNARKSRIYKGKPKFSIFGVGEYSFKPWKIAISSMYSEVNFRLISPLENKPVIFDDTVNFLSFDNENEARFVYKLLTSDIARNFYNSMIFPEEKRPITIDLLKRLSIKSLSEKLGYSSEFKQYFENEKQIRLF